MAPTPRRACCLRWLLHVLILAASGVGVNCHAGHDTTVSAPPPRAASPPPKPSSRPPQKSSPRPPTPKRSPSPPPRTKSPKPPPSPRPPPPPRPPPSPPRPPRPPVPDRTRNGLRLVRGLKRFTGRLEVLIVPDRFLQDGYEENGGWAPLCNDGSFDDARAQDFCNMMGRRYGRKFYGRGISTFGANETVRPTPVGNMQCVRPDDFGRGLPLGKVALPDKFDTKCLVYPSSCPNGELVAVECSYRPLRPRSPPPPAPPSPPPPPPPAPNMRDAINIIPLEANLWESFYGSYESFYGGEPARVELLVNSSADGHTGEPVWALLCAYPRLELGDPWDGPRIANTSCQQFLDLSESAFTMLTGHDVGPVTMPAVSPDGGTVSAGEYDSWFDPSRYTHFVTVVGGVKTGLRSIQEMQLRVSTEPCENGALFGLTCIIQAT